MELINKIDQDLTEAMKEKDELKTSVLRMLKSSIINWQIANKRDAQDTDISQIIQKEVKSRHDSIELFKKGGRDELAQKEANEIEILKKYLPEQLNEEEIRIIVKTKISETGASGIQDMGKIIGQVMAELKGKADGATVSKIVKEELTG